MLVRRVRLLVVMLGEFIFINNNLGMVGRSERGRKGNELCRMMFGFILVGVLGILGVGKRGGRGWIRE